MTEFRLTQISDTHLLRRNFAKLTENFQRVSEHINAARPDLVINTGDVAWDGPSNRGDLRFAEELHAAMPVDCRDPPGNHDIGDNPTAVGAAPTTAGEREGSRHLSSTCSARIAGSSRRRAGASSG